MQSLLIADRQIQYTGEQLRSLWIYETFAINGDAIVGFAGPCNVPTEALVDSEDRRAGATISAALMLHFIIEHFGDSLSCAVLRQRLLTAIIKDLLQKAGDIPELARDGDDIFCGERKLTVSIATVSPVSALIHTGINIDASGAPVAACGLQDFGIEHFRLAEDIVEAYVAEMCSARFAATKVRGVP